MDKKAFHSLLKRYLDGKCTEEEKSIIDRWYDLLDDDAQAPGDESELEDRLWNRIRGEMKAGMPESQRPKPLLPVILRYSAAAAIVVALSISVLWEARRPAPGGKPRLQSAETIHTDVQPRTIVLEDGTRMTIKDGSKVDFPEHFGKNKREVYLDGEAFFDVKKDPARPFFVYNNNLVTEVLGTSFNIKAVRNGIEVAVRTGKVAVYENGNKIPLSDREKLENGVIITPNQKVTYYAETRHFVTSIIDVPLPVPPSAGIADSVNFVYDDTPLSHVLTSIEKVYDIEIVLENEGLRSCPFTGDLTKPSLYNKLEFICQALGASYEIKGTKILLKGGKSCN